MGFGGGRLFFYLRFSDFVCCAFRWAGGIWGDGGRGDYFNDGFNELHGI